MNLLLLGGNSPHNYGWLQEVQSELAPLFKATQLHQYAHWLAGQGNIDLDSELVAVAAQAQALGNYGIFAKSAGALLTLKGVAEGRLAPQWCVLAGLPLAFARQNDFATAQWVAGCPVPIVILQNTNDPTASFAEVQKLVSDSGNAIVSVEQSPGDSHDYLDFAAIKAAITSFL